MAGLAINPCGNNPDSKFSGALSTRQTAIYGSRADIEYDTPALCGSNARFSIAWAMVTGTNDNTGFDGWAQTVYGNFASGAFPVHTGYWEQAQYVTSCDPDPHGTCPIQNLWGNHPGGTTETYNAQYQDNDGHFHFYVSGNSLGETPWNPTNLWRAEWQSQFFGETYFFETDVVGTLNDPVAFLNNSKLVRDAQGNLNWTTFNNLNRWSPPCRYHMDFLNPDQNQNFRIWTHPLESQC